MFTKLLFYMLNIYMEILFVVCLLNLIYSFPNTFLLEKNRYA